MYLARVQDQLAVNLPQAGTWRRSMVKEASSIASSSKQFAHRGSSFGTYSLCAPLKGVCSLGNPEDRH